MRGMIAIFITLVAIFIIGSLVVHHQARGPVVSATNVCGISFGDGGSCYTPPTQAKDKCSCCVNVFEKGDYFNTCMKVCQKEEHALCKVYCETCSENMPALCLQSGCLSN